MTSASLNAMEAVAPAIRSIEQLAQRCANGMNSTLANAETWLKDHEELSLRYKEKWSTWDEACESVYGVTRQAVHKKFARICDQTIRGAIEVDSADSSSNGEQSETLKKVGKLPDPKKPARSHKKKETTVAPAQEPAPAEIIDMDATGHRIPKSIIKTWERREEVQGLMTKASNLKCSIEEGYHDAHDRLFHGGRLSCQTVIHNLQNLHFQLSEIKPDVVCPNCDGSFKDDMGRDCKECCGSGFISIHRFREQWEKSRDHAKKVKLEERG